MSDEGNPPFDLNAMMQQAASLQERMLKAQEEAKQKTVEATAGGGLVTVVISGAFEVKQVRIDAQVIDPKDKGMLEDLVAAAFNAAVLKVQQLQEESMRDVAGGMNIPGLF